MNAGHGSPSIVRMFIGFEDLSDAANDPNGRIANFICLGRYPASLRQYTAPSRTADATSRRSSRSTTCRRGPGTAEEDVTIQEARVVKMGA